MYRGQATGNREEKILMNKEESITVKRLKESFSHLLIETHSQHGDDTAVFKKEAVVSVAAFLKTETELDYNFLMDITAVDYLVRSPRFEVVYHFYSLSQNHRVRVKVQVTENDIVVPSITSLYSIANWMEREVYDMYGIVFSGHPDLRRILLYEGFEGHPLRKDFPVDKRQTLKSVKIYRGDET